ncbi:MAG: hypothetical protein GY719_12880 [bacterium]|nr:hypothetical protein [bacterium]
MTNRTRRPTAMLTIACCLLALTLAGCGTNFGARNVRPARANYGEALSRSWNEQLLLNLVRLRYRDTPLFLEVGSIVTQYDYGGRLAVNEFADDVVGGALEYSETPTITYSPLKGHDFVQRLLAPLPPRALILLSNSGWSVERLMTCCVHRINGVENAPSAAGPTPDTEPEYAHFQRLSKLLRELQKARALQISLEGEEISLTFLPTTDAALLEKLHELRATLGLAESVDQFDVVAAYTPSNQEEIALVGRSLLSVLFYMSQGVKAPAEHEQEGWVTVTLDSESRPLDWWRVMGGLLRIQTAPSSPENAFTRVKYRGHWFYIDDADLNSKTTFNLLTYLFAMQASGDGGTGPLLTLSAGG